MTDPRDPPQLTLPAVDPPATTPELILQRMLARLGHEGPGQAWVHLRCPDCAWLRRLRLPTPGRVRAGRVERMLPRVPVRHWVFSLGESVQPRLVAWPRLRTRVARACVSAVFAWLRRAAARAGVSGPSRCGAVVAIHRVDAALDDDVHVHALVLDGVYTLDPDPDGAPVFHPLPPPRRRDLRRLVAELRSTIDALVARTPAPSPAASPSRTRSRVTQRVVAGPVVQPVAPPSNTGLIQRSGELDVRAGPPVDADDQAARARLCRYLGRSPFDPSALGPGDDGRLRYRLRHPFSDGTTHVELSPRALAERLQALAAAEPRPPISFHGVLAPGAVARWVRPSRPRQLALLDVPARARSRSAVGPRCPRCDTPMEIVGVEPADRRAA